MVCHNPASAVPQPCSFLPLPLQPFSRLPARSRVLLVPTPQCGVSGEMGSCHAEEPLQAVRCSGAGGSRWLLCRVRLWALLTAKHPLSWTFHYARAQWAPKEKVLIPEES